MASLGEILGLQSFQDRRAQGGPQDVANRRRKEQQENALTQLLNQQNVDQNNATLRGTQLQNTQRAREMARGPQTDPYKQLQMENMRQQMAQRAQAPKPSALMEKIGVYGGKPFGSMTPEEKKAAFVGIQKGESTAMDAVELQIKQQKLAQEQAKVQSANDTSEKAEGLKGDVMRLAQELQSHKGLDSSVGSLQGSAAGQFLTVDSDSQDFINKHDQLKSILTADNLDLMSGVLSESDVKILSNIAGGGLQLRGSEAAYRAELAKLGQGGVAPVGEITTQAQYDQLPSGAEYTEDGVKMRKP